MDIFIKLSYLVFITIVISFFVAFLIKMISFFIDLPSRKNKATSSYDGSLNLSQIERIQKEAKYSTDSANIAALSLALHLYFDEIHDNENMTLTINKVIKPYSPWSSKIYSLGQSPR